MTFELEALAALEGDALLLRYGPKNKPQTIIIDGGPASVYRTALRPRLLQLGGTPEKPLPVQLALVSHVDDDHIRGIQDLLADPSVPCLVDGLWHNAFEDIVSPRPAAFSPAVDGQRRIIAASIGQGQSVRDAADRLGMRLNCKEGLIEVRPGGAKPNTFTFDGGLSLTVVCPTPARLEDLRKEWAQYVEKHGAAKAAAAVAASVAVKDGSVFNLSSIAVLARCAGKSMLLTGDALGDDLLAGLKTAGQLDAQGKLAVDVFKLPHHGSQRNGTQELFNAVRARHYVVSTNGDKHNHPDLETLRRLLASRPDDDFTLEFTYEQPKLKTFFAEQAAAGRRPKVAYRAADQYSITLRP
jgi:hypothetical protein